MSALFVGPRLHPQDPADVRQVDEAFQAVAAQVNTLAGIPYVCFTQVQEPAPVMPITGGNFGGPIAAPTVLIVRAGAAPAALVPATDLPTLTTAGPVRQLPIVPAEEIAAGQSQAVDAENVAALRTTINMLLRRLRLLGYLEE